MTILALYEMNSNLKKINKDLRLEDSTKVTMIVVSGNKLKTNRINRITNYYLKSTMKSIFYKKRQRLHLQNKALQLNFKYI
jgi:hypothetical protein